MVKKCIVISGINMIEGGIYTVLLQVLKQFSEINQNNQFEIYALVNNTNQFSFKNINYLGFPKSKKSWLYRLYYEYYYFKILSKKIKPDIWLSLHDITPKVIANKQFVYLHHPTTLIKTTLKDWYFDIKIGLFSNFYDILFKKNIMKNQTVFVQQNWIRTEFEKRFKINNILVAQPEFTEEIVIEKLPLNNTKTHFFYPSFPRSFKNHEVIFEAIKLLPQPIINKTEFHFTTLNNNPHRYAKYLVKKYGNLNNIVLYDLISRKQILALYNSIDCLIFPSKIETWGLPITEAKAYDKKLLLANLPYAKETCGDYEKVSFFDENNPHQLAKLITEIVEKKHIFQGNKNPNINEKIIQNWNDFVTFILDN